MEAISSTTGEDRVHTAMEPVMNQGSLPRVRSETVVKLFGVRITDGNTVMTMRKTVSMGNLSSYNSNSSLRAVNIRSSTPEQSETGEAPGPVDPHGYVSDGLVLNSGALREKKKGVPWTESEHRMFLVGLQKLGKGDWRGIARAFVPSRTPTQVASHAQKYFLRQNNLSKRKRRSSLFDMISSNPGSAVWNTTDQSGNCSTELNLASSASVSADLCLGRPEEAQYEQQQQSQVQRWCHKFSSYPQASTMVGPRLPVEGTKLLQLPASLSSQGSFAESNAKRPRLAGMPMSFSSPSAISSSASSSSLSSLGRIDEDEELAAGLTLSIGPPHLLEPSAEPVLKLEQPSLEGSPNNSGSYVNAIRIV